MAIHLDTYSFVHEIARIVQERARVSEMHEEKQALYLEIAKKKAAAWVREGGEMTTLTADIVAGEVMSTAEHIWAVTHDEKEAPERLSIEKEAGDEV